MDIKACLFDLDGVLVDTAHFHYLAWKKLADRLGFSFTVADNEQLKGISRMDSLNILLKIGMIEASESEKEQYAAEKNETYLNFIKKMTPTDILPGVIDFLKELKTKSVLTGLGSASKNARMILDRTELTKYFDAIVDGNIVSSAKPNPEVFITGAKMLGIQSSFCIVFEDAVAGIQAAHNAGMKCVGIGSPDILKEADLVFPGFMNLNMADLKFR